MCRDARAGSPDSGVLDLLDLWSDLSLARVQAWSNSFPRTLAPSKYSVVDMQANAPLCPSNLCIEACWLR